MCALERDSVNMMMTKEDRIKLLERDVERLENDLEYVIDRIDKIADCSCGGQNCGPTYKPVEDDK